MGVMKLISMTDFVLEQSKLTRYDISDYDWIIRIVNYAKFLKQPLKLEMFVPCDEDGNILEEPKQTSLTCSFFEHQQFFNKQKEYRKAKEKVLFKGFTYNSEYELVERGEIDGSFWSIDVDDIAKYNVEDMVQCDLILTQNATKQFL